MSGAEDGGGVTAEEAEEAEAAIADMVRVAAALRTGNLADGVAIVYTYGGNLTVYGDELAPHIHHAIIAAGLARPRAGDAPAESNAPRILSPRRRRPGRRR